MKSVIEASVEAIRERTANHRFSRQNACLRHGVPFDDRESPANIEVHHTHNHNHDMPAVPKDEIVDEVTNKLKSDKSLKGPPGDAPNKDEIVDEVSTKLKQDSSLRGPQGPPGPAGPTGPSTADGTWPKWVAPALLAAGITGPTAAGLGWYMNRTTPAPPAVSAPDDGSLLQYLEDTGRHLPSE